jgi:hypothetical protein
MNEGWHDTENVAWINCEQHAEVVSWWNAQ